ncbi:helicase-related protein [Microbacterium sp. ASV49]|uniref:Helicase-related protein n=1 Tax=Microbacterium candidum TaxID=3041922 RepID=A0ABT7MVW0_9MICO|nr:helicase-related protein [Microbacterium sp. ASV49]MDL9978595.1 helicase-related protein [Microbacterium sp. ASV49]
MRLEEIAATARLAGIVPGRPVTVLAAQMHGANAVEVTYQDDNGALGQVVLFRDDEAKISPHLESGRPFDADPRDFRLAAEAQRIMLAGLHDPMLAVATSDVQPLPHQIRAVYGEMLPRTPLRFLLADDPGAGKTIMAGLYIKELILRDDVRTCLIVAPGGLVEQWQDELALKFGLEFEILAPGAEEPIPGRTIFDQKPLLIARMDQLARNEALLDQIAQAEFDLVVVDEAHRMSASWWSGELKASKRFQLGELLSERARHFLLMTATPHNGKDEDFQTFLSLLDRDRFAGPGDKRAQPTSLDGLMRRMVKERLVTFEGRPLFPERVAQTASYRLSADEQYLYDEVTEYVRNGMNLADRLEGKRKNTVGFALTVLQRRLASSPEAIHQSLRRRAARLERARVDLLNGVQPTSGDVPSVLAADDPDVDELDAAELEQAEEELVDSATAARTAVELETEIRDLQRLAEIARRLLYSQQDVKWRELRGVINGEVLRQEDGRPRKLIVFTEHRDTLNYLERRIVQLLGRQDAVVAIHGAVPRWERRRITSEFTTNPDVQILLATDAAGEGLNLQAAHLMVNYDLPWNPNRIEQRFGRIHRIGQTEVCQLWNLVAEDTREGDVFIRLLDKIEEQSRAYNGEIFNVLGTSLGDLNLTRVIRDAIRYGEQPEVRERMWQVIDEGVSAGLQELLDDEALANEVLAASDLEQLRREMEDAKARRLQPHFIRDAFIEAFSRHGGRIERRERGRFEITFVPATVRERAGRAPVSRRYERVTFDVTTIELPGAPRAELLAPGHPLHDATLKLVIDRYGPLLDRGTVLASDTIAAPTLLIGVVNEVRDAMNETVSKQFGYSFIGEGGISLEAGPAPYLDFAPPEDGAATAVGLPWLAQREKDAVSWVISAQLPVFASDAIARRTLEFERVRERVITRLTGEANRLYTEALKADANVQAGKRVRYSSETLRRRAEELEERRATRVAMIDRQLAMSPVSPRITAIALVVPSTPTSSPAPTVDAEARARVERRGVDAVLAAEMRLGRVPHEQAHNNPGFDVLSYPTDGAGVRIEVKARIEGADTFTITRTEVLTALNTAPDHRLALVKVSALGSERDEVRYIGDAFNGIEPSWLTDFNVVSQNLSWDDWWTRGRDPF